MGCWAKSLRDKEWIIYTPNLFGIVANIYFLCSILRILLTQLQVHPNEPSNFRKVLKATFVLIPLFGVQLVLTIYRPPPESSFSLYYERFSESVTNSQAYIYFLCSILRILLTQLQVHPNEHSNFRKVLKATFVLIPLFGVQLVLTIYRPPPESSFSLYYERFSESFTNSQLLTLLSHSWRRRRGYEWGSKKGNHSSINMTTVVSRYDSLKTSPSKIQMPCLKNSSDEHQPTAV